MRISRTLTPIDIAVTGMRAQSTRMNVIASNIANAEVTKTADGKPYRRQDVVMSTGSTFGVQVSKIAEDTSPFRQLHRPGPGADADGNVMMPNVDMPTEMINMVTASRAYQANAAVMKRNQEVNDIGLELLK